MSTEQNIVTDTEQPPITDAERLVITDAERLAAYLECERAILLGHQSYTVDGMTFTRADLSAVRTAIAGLRQTVSATGAARPAVGGITTTQVIF